MSFSVVSWNVEFFGSKRRGESEASVRERIDRVFDYLADPEIAAHVYAIYEVNGKQVFDRVKERFPDYSWQITEGSGAQLILVGSRIPAFVTVRTEFSRGYAGPLRPGVLATVCHEGEDYPMLFLHLKAADVPVDFGVRVEQHQKARHLHKALRENGRSNFIVIGDFNSVGLDLTWSDDDISAQGEIDRLTAMYGSSYEEMPIRPKTHPATFWNGPGSSDDPTDIDHVAAASHVEFAQVAGADIEVKGWPEKGTDAAKATWIKDYSDHALLRFTVSGARPSIEDPS